MRKINSEPAISLGGITLSMESDAVVVAATADWSGIIRIITPQPVSLSYVEAAMGLCTTMSFAKAGDDPSHNPEPVASAGPSLLPSAIAPGPVPANVVSIVRKQKDPWNE